MKISETLKTKKAEEAFSAALVVAILIILPMWGGVAMLVGSAIGLVAYTFLFRERLRSRGWLKTAAIPATAAAVVGAVIAIVLRRGH